MCARIGVLPAVGLPRPVTHVARERARPQRAHKIVTARAAAKADAGHATVVVVVPAIRSTARHGRPAHLSAIAQIRREFGVPPAHAAASTSVGRATATTSAAGGAVPTGSPATPAQVNQTQAEFGFEK